MVKKSKYGKTISSKYVYNCSMDVKQLSVLQIFKNKQMRREVMKMMSTIISLSSLLDVIKKFCLICEIHYRTTMKFCNRRTIKY